MNTLKYILLCCCLAAAGSTLSGQECDCNTLSALNNNVNFENVNRPFNCRTILGTYNGGNTLEGANATKSYSNTISVSRSAADHYRWELYEGYANEFSCSDNKCAELYFTLKDGQYATFMVTSYDNCSQQLGQQKFTFYRGTEDNISTDGLDNDRPKYNLSTTLQQDGQVSGDLPAISATHFDDHPVTYYPNPAEDQVTVKVNSQGEGFLTIVNTLGQVVYQSGRITGPGTVNIDLLGIDDGMHFLNLRSEKGEKIFSGRLHIEQ